MRLGILLLLSLGYIQLSYATCVGLGCNCTISANNFNFGSYDPISMSATDSTSIVSVTCSALVINALVGYDIDFSTGNSGSFSTRHLSSGLHTLNYNLYTNASRTLVWGDGTGGTSIINDGYLINILAPVTREYTVYGRIPAQQTVSSGSYSDSIVATVTF